MQQATRFAPATREYWRIVLALAAKDVVDAIKNKTTLTMIVGLALMLVTVEALPLLLKLDDRPRLAIYDADRTPLADELRRGGAVQVLERRNAGEALAAARESSGPLLALALPAGWETESGSLAVDAYHPHWLGAQSRKRLVDQVAAVLTETTGRPVNIRAEAVYPTLENGGHTTMVALGLVLGTVLITTILVPYLILEEKTTHTLALLRVSPVTANQVLLGKGLAGLVYGVLAAAVLLAFNLSLVNLWGILLPAMLGLILFGVGLGLLVGILVENEGAVQMWVALLSFLLLVPLLLFDLAGGRLPAWVQPLARWLPTTAAFDLVRLSFGNTGSAAEAWPRVAALLVAVILVFTLAGWRLRTWEA